MRHLISTLITLNVLSASFLLFSNYLVRDNAYGIRGDQYSVRTIPESEFRRLPLDRQIYWSRMPESETYLEVIVGNSFVSSHKNGEVIPLLALSVLALILSVVAARNGTTATRPQVSSLSSAAAGPLSSTPA